MSLVSTAPCLSLSGSLPWEAHWQQFQYALLQADVTQGVDHSRSGVHWPWILQVSCMDQVSYDWREGEMWEWGGDCVWGGIVWGDNSLIPRPSHCPVFDHLQFAKTEGEGLVHFTMWLMSVSIFVDGDGERFLIKRMRLRPFLVVSVSLKFWTFTKWKTYFSLF